MRRNSQITIPSEIVKSLSIREGDKFEITQVDGKIVLSPVVVYSKSDLQKVAQFLKESNADYSTEANKDINKILKDIGLDVD